MAEHLASIFGTEKDRVNCPFYFKIGACRHGDRCSRLHTKPSISPTLLLSNMYQRPDMITPGVTDFREATCRQYEENVCNRGGYCNFMHLKKISRELRRQLFGKSRRRRSHSRSRSPRGHHGHDERPYGGRGYPRRGGDHRHHERGRRPRSRSPGRRSGHSRSPGGRRNRSPVREGSAERRAKIEQWNREREQPDKNDNSGMVREGSAERRAKIEQWNREREQTDSANNNDVGTFENGSRNGAEHHPEQFYDDYQQQQ
nr:splicing factor U2af small subunit B-like [Ipomoea batatas]GME11540.1 splicing factor U2af small subunit B-like [Ipomoea batatas]